MNPASTVLDRIRLAKEDPYLPQISRHFSVTYRGHTPPQINILLGPPGLIT